MPAGACSGGQSAEASWLVKNVRMSSTRSSLTAWAAAHMKWTGLPFSRAKAGCVRAAGQPRGRLHGSRVGRQTALMCSAMGSPPFTWLHARHSMAASKVESTFACLHDSLATPYGVFSIAQRELTQAGVHLELEAGFGQPRHAALRTLQSDDLVGVSMRHEGRCLLIRACRGGVTRAEERLWVSGSVCAHWRLQGRGSDVRQHVVRCLGGGLRHVDSQPTGHVF